MLKKAKHNYGAYAPNLPGCIATGKTLKKVKKNMPEAIEMHIKGLIEDNISIPTSYAKSEYMAVAI